MKKILFLMTLLVVGVSFAFAQTNADIKFDKTTHDFGKFSENNPVVSCVFTFTNIGDAPLVIHQRTDPAGKERYNQSNLQRNRQISGTLQKVDYPAYQRKNRNGTPLYRR